MEYFKGMVSAVVVNAILGFMVKIFFGSALARGGSLWYGVAIIGILVINIIIIRMINEGNRLMARGWSFMVVLGTTPFIILLILMIARIIVN